MVLGGLWHGAAWTFVIWGGLHGAGLIAEHAIGGRFKTPGWLRWLVTFNVIVLGWIVFRAQGIGEVWTFLSRLGSWGSPTLLTVPVVVAIAVAIGPQLLPPRPLERLQGWAGRLHPAVLAPALGLLILFVAATVPSTGVPPFIYFRF
jgi:alginate O-acetyltransferase complex protein AlgI